MYVPLFEKHFANFNVKQVRMTQKLEDIHLSIIMLEDHYRQKFCSKTLVVATLSSQKCVKESFDKGNFLIWYTGR